MYTRVHVNIYMHIYLWIYKCMNMHACFAVWSHNSYILEAMHLDKTQIKSLGTAVCRSVLQLTPF